MRPYKVYVEVVETEEGQWRISLPTRSLLFLLTYSGPACFQIHLVKAEAPTDQFCIPLPQDSLNHFSHVVVLLSDTPAVVQRCRLPVVYDEEQAMVHSGLCTSVRRIIELADAADPSKNLKEVLGFRHGSLRMSSEVSGWTKICEVELPASLSALITNLRSSKPEDTPAVELPTDLVRMEAHFHKPPRIHNDDKLKRAILKEWQTRAADPATEESVLQHSCFLPLGSLRLSLEVPLHHSTRVFQMEIGADNLKDLTVKDGADENSSKKDFQKETITQSSGISQQIETKLSDLHLENGTSSNSTTSPQSKPAASSDSHGEANRNSLPKNSSEKPQPQSGSACVGSQEGQAAGGGGGDAGTRLDLKGLLERRSYLDVQLMHFYLEGLEMTVADLLLFVYVYHFLEAVDFDVAGLRRHLPRLMDWVGRLVALDRVSAAGSQCRLDMAQLSQALVEAAAGAGSNGGASGGSGDAGLQAASPQPLPSTSHLRYTLPPLEDVSQDDMELSRRCRSKYRAIKPEVQQALQKIEAGRISPRVSSHPRGSQVQLPWNSIPSEAHPQSGGVPGERTQRKCQQLENLATAVEAIAKPGHVVVDFCSGGGHLGILIAQILPQCEVYLVENKEESLLMAKKRIDRLKLRNITMIQCNLEYFHGAFDIGVCLHACGVATDMVLQKCLDQRAGFVLCPCCYGKVQMTHLISYPQSRVFLQAGITYKDFLTLGHAADQTEFNIALEGQGRLCMNLVDTDRAELARERGYSVRLCSLQPLSCTPKNNLLVGTRDSPPVPS